MPVITTSPKISVVIPTYNCAGYITQAIESVLNQTNCNYELLIIDDGSTDNTRQILQPYSKVLRYVYQNNQGVCATRNHGIKIAQGEYVAFLDADDFFLPGKLAAQLAVFEAQPDLGIVHSGWRRVDSQGQTLMDVQPWENIAQLNLESWLQWKPVLPSAMMFRRQWLEKVGGFDPQYTVAEDVDLVLRLSLAGCQAQWLRQVTVCYRQREESAMTDGLPQARDLTTLMDNFFSQPNLPENIRLLEKEVRYGTLVWIAWYLNHTGQSDQMIPYLQRACNYTPYLPMATVVNWADSFAEYARNIGVEFDADSLGKSPEWRNLMGWVITNTKDYQFA